jgi:hypothetical protein
MTRLSATDELKNSFSCEIAKQEGSPKKERYAYTSNNRRWPETAEPICHWIGAPGTNWHGSDL